MKATLTFDLSDPDDRIEHLRCIKSLEMAAALFQIVNNAHRHVETIEQYRSNISAAVGELNIDELIN